MDERSMWVAVNGSKDLPSLFENCAMRFETVGTQRMYEIPVERSLKPCQRCHLPLPYELDGIRTQTEDARTRTSLSAPTKSPRGLS